MKKYRHWVHSKPTTRLPGQIRSQIRFWLRVWRVSQEVSAEVQQAANEIVTNAITHASAPVRITLRMTTLDRYPAIEFSVRDASPTMRESREDRADYGRGFALVLALSDCFGVTSHPDGKSIWFIRKVA